MGRLRIAKKATKGKGKQWKKGHSSDSNPMVRKFRSKITSLTGPLPGSAEAAAHEERRKMQTSTLQMSRMGLAKSSMSLNAAVSMDDLSLALNNDWKMNLEMNLDQDGDQDMMSDGAPSCISFASAFTSCTNITFAGLLNKWNSKSALHKDMLAVLAAVTETIKERGGSETETEYFAALVTTIEGLASKDQAQAESGDEPMEEEPKSSTGGILTAAVSLLNMVLPRVNQNILKVQFSSTSTILVKLLDENLSRKDRIPLLRASMTCLAHLLRIQEEAIWRLSSTQAIYIRLLALLCHSKPRVRREANQLIVKLLKESECIKTNQPADKKSAVKFHPAAAQTADHFIRQIDSTSLSDPAGLRSLLHIVNLLKELIALVPHQTVKRLSETLLKLMTLGNPLLVNGCLQAFHHLFESRPGPEICPIELNSQIISALLTYQPGGNDVQPLVAWGSVMVEAYANLCALSPSACMEHIGRLLKVLIPLLLNESQEDLHQNTITLLRQVTVKCLEPGLSPQSEVSNQQICSFLDETFNSVLNSFQFAHVWSAYIAIYPRWTKILSAAQPAIALSSTVSLLVDLRENSGVKVLDFKACDQIDVAVGNIVQRVGAEEFLKVVSLDFSDPKVGLKRAWLIPVLRKSIQGGSLRFYSAYFTLVMKAMQSSAISAAQQGRTEDDKSYAKLIEDCWSLLPAFCRAPNDLSEGFKPLAPKLGSMLKDSDSLREYVLAALRNLVKSAIQKEESSNDQDDRKLLAGYAKNYLPILFNLYTTECGLKQDVRSALLHTVEIYLTIAPLSLTKALATNILSKIAQSTAAADSEKRKQRKNKDKDKKMKSSTKKDSKTEKFLYFALLDLVRCFVPILAQHQTELDPTGQELVVPLFNLALQLTQPKPAVAAAAGTDSDSTALKNNSNKEFNRKCVKKGVRLISVIVSNSNDQDNNSLMAAALKEKREDFTAGLLRVCGVGGSSGKSSGPDKKLDLGGAVSAIAVKTLASLTK